MSDFRPFRAVRPVSGLEQKVNCPPYDVISYEEAKEIGRNPESFVHVIRAEIDLPEEVDHYDEVVYQKASENLKRMLAESILIQEDQPMYYVYWQKMKSHIQMGIVGCASVDEYQQSKIKRHELTRQDKEEDRVRHIHTTRANTGLVYLTFRSTEKLEELLSQYVAELPVSMRVVDENDVEHRLYGVKTEEKIEELRRELSGIECMYIADGHHRAASSSRVRELLKSENERHTGQEEYNYFMAVTYPHSQLRIMDYNRVVKDLNGMDTEQFLKRVGENFEIAEAPEKPYAPEKRHEFGMCLEGKWYVLNAKESIFDNSHPVRSLDVDILQKNLLEPILGIENPRKDSRIDFVGGIRGLKALENRIANGWAVAFSMFPTSMEELLAVADNDMIMPPKSTWFEPKLRSGLVLHLI